MPIQEVAAMKAAHLEKVVSDHQEINGDFTAASLVAVRTCSAPAHGQALCTRTAAPGWRQIAEQPPLPDVFLLLSNSARKIGIWGLMCHRFCYHTKGTVFQKLW